MVISDAVLEREKWRVEAAGAEFPDVGSGEVLKLRSKYLRGTTNLMFGAHPTAAPTAPTRSRNERAMPVQTLNKPLVMGYRGNQLTTATQSLT